MSEQSLWIKSTKDMIRTCVCVRLLGHSHQPLQGPLLIDLVGAVCDVRVEAGLSVPAHDVADVVDHYVLLVSFFQFLKEPEDRMNTLVSGSRIHTIHGCSWRPTRQSMSHATVVRI